VLEREFGRVDADDDEARALVRVGPALDVGERPQAVDAGVRPEVDQDDLAAELRQRQRLGVEPPVDAREVRSLAEVAQLTFRQHVAIACQQAVELALGRARPLHALEGVGVAGHVRGQAEVEPEDHEHGHARDHPAESLANPGRVRAQCARVDAALPGEREEEKDDSRAERVRERHEHGLEREPARGCESRDRRDHWARAGCEEKAEAHSEEEPAADIARSATPERLEGPFDQPAQLWDQEREADEEDDPDGDVAQEVVRKVQGGQKRSRREGERGETRDEARDDGVRPLPAAARTPGEDDRKDREDAG
jgi:hypothetical protein